MAVLTHYYSGGYLPAALAQNRSEQWDNGPGTYTAWDSSGNVTQSRALTTAETAQLAAADTAATADANGATIRARAQAALTANATYLAIVGPTTAQAVAQVATLTKECNGLIRLALSVLDSTTGT